MPSDTLTLKNRRTEKPPESDDEEMKEAAGSLLHLAGIRSCLNNITNRPPMRMGCGPSDSAVHESKGCDAGVLGRKPLLECSQRGTKEENMGH